MTATDELKPCPFCGGEAKLMKMDYEGGEVWGVFCKDDLAAEYSHGHYIDNYMTAESAIAAWNRRAETVEPRTCKLTPDDHYRVDKVTTSWGCVCSACGGFHQYTHGEGWAYCPSCGREVVDG